MLRADVEGSPGNQVTVQAAPEHAERAQLLARKLGNMVNDRGEAQSNFRVEVGASGLSVAWRVSDPNEERRLHLDWCSVRPGRDPIVRAVGGASRASEWTVVDATAGLGADAVALARAGFRVTLIERDALLHELLIDARERAVSCPNVELGDFAARIEILQGDARTVLPQLTPRPDVVFLDPMYPQQGRGGAKRHGASFLRAWLGPKGDEARAQEQELLAVARSVARHRVVVKRPLQAPDLAKGVTGAIRGSTTRFDLYPVVQAV